MDEWKPFIPAWSLIFSAKAYDLCNSRECRAAGPKFSSKVETRSASATHTELRVKHIDSEIMTSLVGGVGGDVFA